MCKGAFGVRECLCKCVCASTGKRRENLKMERREQIKSEVKEEILSSAVQIY